MSDSLGATCPSCRAALSRWPGRKTICPDCGEPIFVRTSPRDGARILVNDTGRREIEAHYERLRSIDAPLTGDIADAALKRKADHRAWEIEAARSAIKVGLYVEMSILGAPHSCPASHSIAADKFGPDNLPPLPLPNCSIPTRCPCCVTIRALDEPVRRSSEEIERDLTARLEALPRDEARALYTQYATTFQRLGIEFAS